MILIIGLGNPGREYSGTRHNIGFSVLDHVSKRYNIKFSQRICHSRVGEGKIGELKVVLVKPQTYMNLSGQAVAAIMRRFKILPKDIIVIHDDLDLPLGKIRIRLDGGSGGHNGIKSIIQSIGTNCFARIRIGITRPASDNSDDVVDHVLSRFEKDESMYVKQAITDSVNAIAVISSEGFNAAMNRYN